MSQNIMSCLVSFHFLQAFYEISEILVTKRDIFTKSKNTASQVQQFSCIKLLPNRSDFTLKEFAGAWPRFEGMTKFTRKAMIPLPFESGSLSGQL